MTPPRRSVNSYLLIAVAGLALLVLASVVLVLARVAEPAVQRLRAQATTVVGTAAPPLTISDLGMWRGADRVTILLLGIDQRPGEDPGVARTDTMILVTIDPQKKTAGMLGIPRDLYVPLPDRGQGRINTAHVYGGPEYAMRAVELNLGLPVNHYVRVNFEAVVTLIDLAGGVVIDNPTDIDDPLFPDANYGYDPFKLSAGVHTLDGRTALKYARTRHGDSDFYRIRRQQQVIMALRQKFLGSDAITKLLPNAPAILQALRDSVSTDLSEAELVQLALLMRDIPEERIAHLAIDEKAVQPWTTPSGGSVVIPVRERLRELREQLLNPTAARDGTDGTIAIYNGTQTRGLAAAARKALEQRGYRVTAIGDAAQPAQRTQVLLRGAQRTLAEQLVRDVGLTGVAIVIAPNAPGDADVVLVLGDDYAAKP
jgi:LCP family protein required for cell wall assembly